jgi:hypothetical protein
LLAVQLLRVEEIPSQRQRLVQHVLHVQPRADRDLLNAPDHGPVVRQLNPSVQ